jgi:hypothetical protein
MQSIAFNMAEIKGACDYYIKDVVWMTADHYETLIDVEGTKNFYVKEGAGTSPYEFGHNTVANPCDLNGSGVVDVTDLSLVIDYIWAEDLKGDVNNDNKVDVTDLSLVIEAIWAEQ